MRKKLLALSTAVILASPLANAVVLNPRGTGQVLLYPYYTVNEGNNTLLTVGNMTDRGKAVRIRFSEGHNGREVLGFNIYLSPYDVWTSAIFPLSDDGSANLVTDDSSCTVPGIKTSSDLPSLSDGRKYVPFSNSKYVTPVDDSGSDDLARTRAGMIEVIEMGTVAKDSAVEKAMMHQDGVPKDCGYLLSGWTNGFWSQDSTTDLVNPTGGLFGSVAIINIAAGTMLSYNAEALDEFRQDPTDFPRGSKNSVVLHTLGNQPHPNLSDALTDPANKLASASVFVDGQLLRADYPAETQAIDAVSAVFMADTLANDFVVEPAIGAQSEWIVTFPTKRFYTDQGLVGDTPIVPFSKSYPDQDSQSARCMEAGFSVYDREENSLTTRIGRVAKTLALCQVVQEVNFFYQFGFILPENTIDTDPFKTGWAKVSLANSLVGGDVVFSRQMRAGAFVNQPSKTIIFNGLPVIGFLATNYVNNNVQQGVLANYSGTFPHRTISSAEGTFVNSP